MIERVSSGIPGLDELIEGGFVKGSINLIAGTTGTCKTTFCTQFIWHGLQNNEPGVYVTVEQEAEEIIKSSKRFGFDFEPYIQQGKCLFIDCMPESLKELEKVVFNSIVKIDAKRFVLDSLTVALLGLREIKDPALLRREVFRFSKRLKALGVTSLLISEVPETQPKALARFGFEEFVADGVIVLYFLEYSAGSRTRSLMIRKMRNTDHAVDIFPFQLTENGIVVKS